MALPAWVFNQTALPPWARNTGPLQPPRPTTPPPVNIRGQNTAATTPNYFSANNTLRDWGSAPRPTTISRGMPPTDTPTDTLTPAPNIPNVPAVNSISQPTAINANNTNTGMMGMLPPPQNEPEFQLPPDNNSGVIEQLLSTIRGNQSGLQNQYSGLMNQFQGALNQPGQTFKPYVPETQTYTQSPDLSRAIEMIRALAESGGYSEADQSNIRARGISPIRSIYANAQQGLERNKALQGGYSPNFAAASAKMAREASDRISQQTTNINADLAEKIAQGKMAITPQLAAITGHVNDLINQIAGQNVGARNEAGKFNTEMEFNVGKSNLDRQTQIRDQIANLFGTGAGMNSSFMNQLLQGTELGQRAGQNTIQNQLSAAELNQRTREANRRGMLDTADLNFRMGDAANRNLLSGAELSQRGQESGNRNALDWADLNLRSRDLSNRNTMQNRQFEQEQMNSLIQMILQSLGRA